MHSLHHPTAPLHARRQGHGAPVVCLHASGSSARQWRPLFEALAWRADWMVGRAAPAAALAPDFLGHGASPPWPHEAPSHLDVDARAVARLLPRGSPVHLVGHSYGAAIALWLAQQMPERVASLALYEPVAFGLLPDAPHDAARLEVTTMGGALCELAAHGRMVAAARAFSEYWSGADAWTSLNAAQQGAVIARMPAVVRHFEALADAHWRPAALARPDLPVLLLEGTHTRAPARRIVDALAEAWPQAQRCRIAGAGHMGPLTHPESVTRELMRHLGDALWQRRPHAAAAAAAAASGETAPGVAGPIWLDHHALAA